MRYENTEPAIFLERPNRFTALVEREGKRELCHVKNTGRLGELLISGAEVCVQRVDNPGRKTALDLISVKKGDRWVNIDSQAPNRAAAEWLERAPGAKDFRIRPEYTYGDSRFDFYLEAAGKKAFLEVKGVTLEENGAALFPDAPTERGLKHLRELISLKGEGCGACLLFVIQMKGIKFFRANEKAQPAFGETLKGAAEAGVRILAYDCITGPDKLVIDSLVEVRL